MKNLVFLGLCLLLVQVNAALPYKSIYSSNNGGSFTIKDGKDSNNAIAWGYYIDNIATNGWGNLTIVTNPAGSVSDLVRMRAAGYLEGYLTAERISQNYINFYWQSLAKHANVTYPGRILIKNSPGSLYNKLPPVLVTVRRRFFLKCTICLT